MNWRSWVSEQLTFRGRDRQAAEAPKSFRDLSPSIALKRKFFGGRSDGELGVPSIEVSLFQVLISAGDN
jgi:hypothetical protein